MDVRQRRVRHPVPGRNNQTPNKGGTRAQNCERTEKATDVRVVGRAPQMRRDWKRKTWKESCINALQDAKVRESPRGGGSALWLRVSQHEPPKRTEHGRDRGVGGTGRGRVSTCHEVTVPRRSKREARRGTRWGRRQERGDSVSFGNVP